MIDKWTETYSEMGSRDKKTKREVMSLMGM